MTIEYHVYWTKQDCDGIGYLEHTEIVLGSDYDFDDNGVEIATEPEYETYFTLMDETLRCDSAYEIKLEIEDMLQKSLAYDGLETMEKLLNTALGENNNPECIKCGDTETPLHTNHICGNCWGQV